jgi:hypothetical protein
MNQHVIPFSINRPFSTASTSLTTTFRNDPDEPSSPFPSSSPSRLFTSSPCREDQNSSDDPFLSSPSRLQQTVLPSAPEQIKVDSQSSRALFLPNAHSHTESPGEIQHISFTPSRVGLTWSHRCIWTLTIVADTIKKPLPRRSLWKGITTTWAVA